MRFIDLFAGLGGFAAALRDLGHECVFASEIDDELRELYGRNFPDLSGKVYGDIRMHKDKIPAHHVLCAGFPCQPFSKSGTQLGVSDQTRGTLFHEILEILRRHHPQYVILENVGNFERHDSGRTWQVVRQGLEELGYDVRGTEHITSRGSGLLSPHHLGYPHSRERFYVVASLGSLPPNPFPRENRSVRIRLEDVLQSASELTDQDQRETALTRTQFDCIEHWNRFLTFLPKDSEIPSFPIWGDELDATYPYESTTPYAAPLGVLAASLNGYAPNEPYSREDLLRLLPAYARRPEQRFPSWKVRFIDQNRAWLTSIRGYLPSDWVSNLRQFPPSLRKLEWNCKGEPRDLWRHVLQFRPSGLRVKRYTSVPALVAMTTTQIPILGPQRRFLTRIEGLRLQGFADSHLLPVSRSGSFRALGNAVHVGVVREIAVRNRSGG